MQLFLCEFKRILKSKTFWFFLILMAAFMHMQMGLDLSFSEPQIGDETYGRYKTDDIEVIKEAALRDLLISYSRNAYDTYPMGFYRNRELNVDERETMTKMLSSLTGLSFDDIYQLTNQFSKDNLEAYAVTAHSKEMAEEAFVNAMDKVDQVIGGGSFFERDRIYQYYGKRQSTYEEAMKRYEILVNQDKITGGVGRYMNDYLGFFMLMLTPFLTTAFWHKDTKTQVKDLLSSKAISSRQLVLTRNAALICAFLLMSLLVATFYNLLSIFQNPSQDVAWLSIYWITFLWQLPIIAIGVAVPSLITILTSKTLAIPIMVFTWFINFLFSSSQLVGNYGAKLIIRHNSVYERHLFYDQFRGILFNRFMWLAIAVLVTLAAVKSYDEKRKGKIGYDKV